MNACSRGGKEGKESKERHRKGIPEGREARSAEGLAAVLETEHSTKGPRQEALTEFRDRLTGSVIKGSLWVITQGSGLCRSWFRENQGLGLKMLNWTSRGRCVIESWMNSDLKLTRFGNRRKRGSD